MKKKILRKYCFLLAPWVKRSFDARFVESAANSKEILFDTCSSTQDRGISLVVMAAELAIKTVGT